jgi:sigma-B regulation protein RsbQ
VELCGLAPPGDRATPSCWRRLPERFLYLCGLPCGSESDLSAYSRSKYSTLAGYADDVLDICRTLDLREVVFVGHSVSAMIGERAARSPGQ